MDTLFCTLQSILGAHMPQFSFGSLNTSLDFHTELSYLSHWLADSKLVIVKKEGWGNNILTDLLCSVFIHSYTIEFSSDMWCCLPDVSIEVFSGTYAATGL